MRIFVACSYRCRFSLWHFQRHANRRVSGNLRVARPLMDAASSILPRLRLKAFLVNQRLRRFAYTHNSTLAKEEKNWRECYCDSDRFAISDGHRGWQPMITNVIRRVLLRPMRACVGSSAIYACINYATV